MNGTADERLLMTRLTWRLIPFLGLCFLAAFLDRVNVGFAALQMLRFTLALVLKARASSAK